LGTFSLVDLVIGPLPTTVAVFLPAALPAPPPPPPPLDDADDTFSSDFCNLPGGGGDSTVGSGGSGWCGDGGDGSPAVRSSTTTVTCRSSDSGLMMPSFGQSAPDADRPATGDAEYDGCGDGLQLMSVGDVDGCCCW